MRMIKFLIYSNRRIQVPTSEIKKQHSRLLSPAKTNLLVATCTFYLFFIWIKHLLFRMFHLAFSTTMFHLAFSTTMFAFSGASNFPTIQSDMNQSKHFGRSVIVAMSSKPFLLNAFEYIFNKILLISIFTLVLDFMNCMEI